MNIDDFKLRAQKSIDHFSETLKTVRTGRANPSLLDSIHVEAYGSRTPLSQVSSISAPEPRLLTINVWDSSIIESIVTAIKNSELGVNPVVDGNLIRLNLPSMTEERRVELTKVVGKYAEETKVTLRNLRHEFLADLKKRKDEQKLPEAVVKGDEERVDTEVKKFNEKIDEISKTKQKELMEV